MNKFTLSVFRSKNFLSLSWLAAFCLILIVFILPKYSSAQVFVPVLDQPNLAQNSITAAGVATLQQKESVLDAIAWSAAKIIISNMTNSIVNWINSGFEGSPAFVTDPEAFLIDVGDQIAGNFIAGTEIGFICEPFQLELRRALNFSFSSTFTRANYCRLSDVVSNVENFTKFTDGDFSRGGWNSWFEISQNPSNNPLGVYSAAKAEIVLRTARGQEIELAKLNWGQGFLSWRDCEVRDDQTGECIKYSEIKTPGSVIENQLSQTLGSGIRQLELADEFNEIIGALVGQLARTVLTDGLSSFSSGGRNYNSLGGQELTVSCYADKSSTTVGSPVRWSAFVYGGGTGQTSYLWSGSSPILGTIDSVVIVYDTPGIKTANVRVTKDGQNVFRTCYSEVNVTI